MAERQPISVLPGTLKKAQYPGTTYQRVYHAAVAGDIPAERGGNGRWTFSPSDLPAIAKGLGLTADARAA